MTYQEAIDFLNAPKYSATRPGLGPVTELLSVRGDPQEGLKVIHITGTNGKGSTAAYIESALTEAGYKTGLYTSPFIERFTERIMISGEEIPGDDLARLTQVVKDAVDYMVSIGHTAPTIFEMVTAVAFLYYKEQACDFVVLEVGMGGRLDATNVFDKVELSVITTIDFDHMQFLGNTIEEIAWEKAGIIKSGCPVVCFPQRPESERVLREEAAKRNAPITFLDPAGIKVLKSDITGQVYRFAQGPDDSGNPGIPQAEIEIGKLGSYQVLNSALAYLALKTLQREWGALADESGELCEALPDEAILTGLKKAVWKGRLEVIRRDPLIILDGAHNPNGVEGLVDSLEKLFPGQKFIFVCGVLADKDYLTMFRMTEHLAEEYFTVTPSCSRALSAPELAKTLDGDGMKAVSFGTIPEGLDAAIARATARNAELRERLAGGGADGDTPFDLLPEAAKIICFGSLYFIGDARLYLTGKL